MNGIKLHKKSSFLNILFIISIAITPLFRGLFFREERLSFFIIISILCALIYYYNKELLNKHFKFDTVKILYGILTGLYLLTIFWAPNKEIAYSGFIIHLSYFLTLITLGVLIKDIKLEKSVYVAFYVIGVLVAFIGMLSYWGFDIYRVRYTGRIDSTLQYTNTLATYLTATFLLGVPLIDRANKHDLLMLLGNITVFSAFLGTASRGGLLILLILSPLVAYFLLRAKETFKIFNIVVSIIMSTVYMIIIPKIDTESMLGLLIFAIVLGAGASFYIGVSKVISKINYKTIVILLIAILVVVIAIIGFIGRSSEIVERFSKISFSEKNVFERFVFYQDAIKVIRDNLLGLGAGGWEEVYRSYQSTQYFTTEVHNHYLQVFIEVGIFGGAAYIIIIILTFLRGLTSSYISKNNLHLAFSFLSFLSLTLHSMIDFDLSLSAVYILLIVTMVLINDNQVDRINLQIKHSHILLTMLTIVLLLTSVHLLQSTLLENKARKELENNDSQAIATLNLIRQVNPLNSYSYTYLGEIAKNTFEKNGDVKYLESGQDLLEKATYRNKFDTKTHNLKSEIAYLMGNYELAIQAAKYTVSIIPNQISGYEKLATTYIRVAKILIVNGDKEKGLYLLKELMNLEKDIVDRKDGLSEQELISWKGPKLEITPLMAVTLMEANGFLGNWDEMLRIYSLVADNRNEWVSFWAAVAITEKEPSRDNIKALNEIIKDEKFKVVYAKYRQVYNLLQKGE